MAVDEWDLIPGSRLRNPAQAIAELWEPSDSVTAAVAFVTGGGVHDLIDLVGKDLSRLELTVRAAPISEPRALLDLEAAGARVHGIAGTRAQSFHPKLWLGHTSDWLMVLSGLANLTTSALTQNREQMELFSVSAGSDAATAHLNRFSELIVDRLSLAELTDTPYWERWETLQTRLTNEQRDLADELSKPLGLPDPRHAALREALRWSDVDLAKSEIRIERGWDEVEGPISAKSKKGKRTVPIPAALSDYLREHRAATRTNGFVFGEAQEEPLRAAKLSARGKRLWTKKGMAPITLHECRHTYASLMIAAGVNFKALSEFMGHSDIAITLDRYGHLLPGAGDEAAELLDKYLNDWRAERARKASLSEASAPLEIPASEYHRNTVGPLSTALSSPLEHNSGQSQQGQVSA